jgi:phosphoserine phosphatase
MNKDNCRFYCYRNGKIPTNKTKNKIEKLKLVVFDMDGVLTDIVSSWKYIHDYFNTSNEESVNAYLKGEIDDLEIIKRDADLWVEDGRPITQEKLNQILSDVPIMKGAYSCINFLKEQKITTAIVSAGLDLLANRVKKELKIDYCYSNGVNIDLNGRLNGVGILKVKLKSKNEVINKLSNELKIIPNNIISVGNSCFDIPMFEASGCGIAFNPGDNCVKKAADYVVNEKDLTKILPFIKKVLKY